MMALTGAGPTVTVIWNLATPDIESFKFKFFDSDIESFDSDIGTLASISKLTKILQVRY
jgi:hypothetical protein